MLSTLRRVFLSMAAATALVAPLAVPAQAQTVLRFAPHSDLKILDPIWTTALITTDHGMMVYDTLFAVDDKLEVKPQMVDKWEVSPDKLTWTFTLRDGLEWHDGTPVTAEDCVASLKRWGAKDTMGQKLMSAVTELSAPDAKTIKMVLSQPYGLVLETLGKSSSNIPFMMPKRIAQTDPNTQITDPTGSGPFIFKKDEWKPGEKIVYVKNPRYKPRNEPPSGLAGGKVAKVDRVEWIWIADTQTQANALMAGEIDILEMVPPDLLPLLEKDKNIKTFVVNTAGRQYAMRFNTLYKPFDNPKIRLAALYALDQKEILEANVGDPKYYTVCKSLFPCGSPLESTKGWEDKLSGNAAKAKQLLQEAGYDGTPIVMMHQTDVPGHNNLATVAKPQLEKAGFKVDLQPMDWQTLVSRRAKKDPPDKGGWNVFFTSWGSTDVLNPVSTAFLNASCDKATFGWPCDAELEKLRDAYAKETDPAKQKAIAEQVQLRMLDYPTHAPLGQYTAPSAMRSNITGLLHAPALALWNVQKN
ncbi:peptide/nickel transport system substrate-binding protein [Enhydrobacter aerosaccus]|uniref:Peptide/nickel transport system substrate-binding protein n=1 Tax=Enhydrobacter aerosaccus TaxID=225324 RepID=A0A1T4SV05_9HYPH|nr:ABC transporter substrate-binding protein [Enhydrobacter aerosaccus]SKA31731.1 peptide/nickel transport system substrate-binding protein [Enhydrobacter aerosaccus]